jgi:hypothetical protein
MKVETGAGAQRRPRRRRVATLAAAIAAALTATDAAGARRVASSRGPPQRLADTGLYSDFASGTIDPRNLPYSPQYPLWTDGASKRRWIRLPAGKAIDASDPEDWKFPVGTRIWKEFAWERRVETRYMERTRDGWIFATYAWREDGNDAALVGDRGLLSTYEVAPGRKHAIPSVADCKNCHEGGRAAVLGFNALQLSRDRDPLAPHAEPLEPGMATLDVLARRKLVRGLPRALVERPPRIDAATPRERAVLGYLTANCGICHDAVGPIASLGLVLRRPVRARAGAIDPIAAAFGHASRFQIPGAAAGTSVWIAPGASASSVLAVRMGSRNPAAQMPPLGTQLVDEEALRLVRGWIDDDLRPGATAPGAITEAGRTR